MTQRPEWRPDGRRNTAPAAREHALVLGGSMAGLAIAAVLATRFEQVTIVERDTLPPIGQHRRGVPQRRHVHVLVPAGVHALTEVLPGLIDDLRTRGAQAFDASAVRFHIAGGSLLLDDASDVRLIAATGLLIEETVRERVRALPNVRFVEGCDVRGLAITSDRSRVTGARVLSWMDPNAEEVLAADLVVDATGRGSRSPRWLTDLGYAAPDQELMHVGVHYTTRLFHRGSDDLEGCRNVTVSVPPGGRRGGVALAAENDRWVVTLIGYLGERAPTDLEAFVEYARTLWNGDIHALVAGAEPTGEAWTGAHPQNVRSRYDRLRRFPDRYVVMGDAVCAFNPVYAQGMSVAVLEALTLGSVLDRHGLARVGPRFFRRTKRLIDQAWTICSDSDLSHPDVRGPRTARWRFLNTYIRRLMPAAQRDPVVGAAFLAVIGMVAPPEHLMHPRIVRRVLRSAGAARAPDADQAHALATTSHGQRRQR